MKRTIAYAAFVLLVGLVPAAGHGATLYAHVSLFDVDPAAVSTFEAKVFETGNTAELTAGFVEERFLRSVDPLNARYAIYTKFTDLAALNTFWAQRLALLDPYLVRDPEVHTATVTDAFTPSLVTANPQGGELGSGLTGQIAHLGLFVPFAEHRPEYERILHLVKNDTRDRAPTGFIGEELLEEIPPATKVEQTPYSPRPLELVPMSINYGEFATIEDAENAYIQRASDRTDDPRLRYWYRAFFGSLQVPSRFYIYEVVGSLPSASKLAEAAPAGTERTRGSSGL